MIDMNEKSRVTGRLWGVEFDTDDPETIDVVRRIMAKANAQLEKRK